MSTAYYGISGDFIVSNTLDNIKENIKSTNTTSKLNLKLEKEDEDTYSISNDLNHFEFNYDEPYLLGVSNRYGCNKGDVLVFILKDIFQSSKVLTEYDYTYLKELGIYE